MWAPWAVLSKKKKKTHLGILVAVFNNGIVTKRPVEDELKLLQKRPANLSQPRHQGNPSWWWLPHFSNICSKITHSFMGFYDLMKNDNEIPDPLWSMIKYCKRSINKTSNYLSKFDYLLELTWVSTNEIYRNQYTHEKKLKITSKDLQSTHCLANTCAFSFAEWRTWKNPTWRGDARDLF